MRRRTTRLRITTRMDADIDYCGDEVMMMRRRRKKKKEEEKEARKMPALIPRHHMGVSMTHYQRQY